MVQTKPLSSFWETSCKRAKPLNEEASTARENPTEGTCTITHEETQVSTDSNGDAKHSGDDTGENAAPENESLQGGSNNGTSGNADTERKADFL